MKRFLIAFALFLVACEPPLEPVTYSVDSSQYEACVQDHGASACVLHDMAPEVYGLPGVQSAHVVYVPVPVVQSVIVQQPSTVMVPAPASNRTPTKLSSNPIALPPSRVSPSMSVPASRPQAVPVKVAQPAASYALKPAPVKPSYTLSTGSSGYKMNSYTPASTSRPTSTSGVRR